MHLDPFSGHGPVWSQGEVRPFTRPALHDSLVGLGEYCALGPTKPLSARVREGFFLECFLSGLTPRDSCQCRWRTNVVIRVCRYCVGAQGCCEQAITPSGPGSKGKPIWMHCNPGCRNARDAGWLAFFECCTCSHLLTSRETRTRPARPLTMYKTGGKGEGLYMLAGMASSITSPCRRHGLGTRHNVLVYGRQIAVPQRSSHRRYEDMSKLAGWMLRPGARCGGA